MGREQKDHILLHREVAKRKGLDIDGKEVDHEDLDGLNCRRGNLRVATRAQNSRNGQKHSNNTSGHKGVTWYRRDKVWQAAITVDGTTKYLGRFANKEDAARAYAEASARLHGEFGRTA